MKKLTTLILLLCLLVTTFGCGGKDIDLDSQVTAESGLLEVHIIDVGQADAILIRTPEQGDILIDGGTNAAEDDLIAYLKQQGVTRLAAVIATHPHEDHIGGLDGVLNTLATDAVYLPKVSHTTATFEKFLTAVTNSKAKTVQVKSDVPLSLGAGGAQGVFLAPKGEEYDELNDYSAVLKLVYGNTSFMFTGDAEKLSEGEILAQYNSDALAANVLKVGHHGSQTSTSEAFLKAVNPELAVISVGKDNDYGLPHPDTIALLEREKIPYLRTDEAGSIVIYSDGQNISLSAEDLDGGQAVATDTNLPAVNETSSPAPTAPEQAPSNATNSVTLTAVDRRAEIATITNNGSAAVDLSGWQLVSVQGDQTYTIPEGTTLAAGAALQILSGPDAQAQAGKLVWSNKNIWNNDHDPAQLYNAAGELVATVE